MLLDTLNCHLVFILDITILVAHSLFGVFGVSVDLSRMLGTLTMAWTIDNSAPSGRLLVSARFQHCGNSTDVLGLIMSTWGFDSFSESRWLGLGSLLLYLDSKT